MTTGRLSWRRLDVLIEALPRDSLTVRTLVGEAARWGDTEHLLADVVDVLQSANWQRVGKKSAPRPKPVTRPGVTPTGEARLGGKSAHTPEEMAAIQARWSSRERTEEPS